MSKIDEVKVIKGPKPSQQPNPTKVLILDVEEADSQVQSKYI